MKSIIFSLLLFSAALAQDSTRIGSNIGVLNVIPGNGTSLFFDSFAVIRPQATWVTDSVVWMPSGILFAGKESCKHDWCFSEAYTSKEYVTFGCLAIHGDGEHCSYLDKKRSKICRLCLREESERERWYQRYVTHQKTEFEVLKEKQATLSK